MKTNTKKPRKSTHKFIDASRVTRVVVMPLVSTRAHYDRFKYGLPAIFEVDHTARHSEYIKSVNNANYEAQFKESEINNTIAKDLGAENYHGTFILEKVNRSSIRVSLI